MTGTDHRIRLGWLADQRMTWTALLDRARYVEELGYDGVWLSDHFMDEQGAWLLDGWTSLAALLAQVPRVEAGFLVASNSLRAPRVTAHMTSTLTEIGGGRFVLGLGAGGDRDEHLEAGVGFARIDERVAALESTCRMIRGTALRRVPPAPEGHAPGRDDPPIPLLIGGAGEAVLRIAGRYADRWIIWGGPDQLAERGKELDRSALEAGRDPREIRRGAIVMLLPEHLPEQSDPSPWPAELRGGRSAVAAQLARYRAAGVGDVIVCDYGLDPAARSAALAWFAEVVAAA